MNSEPRPISDRLYQRREKAYLLIGILFTIITGLSLGYGLWAAFQYADNGDPSDLARLLTSGFLFVFSGAITVGVWVRLEWMEESRRLAKELGLLTGTPEQ